MLISSVMDRSCVDRRLLQGATALLPPAVALLVGITAGADQLLTATKVVTLLLLSLAALAWFGHQFILVALLTAGYFSGWIKLRYASWMGYVLPDALCVLLLAYACLRRLKSDLPLPRNGLTLGILGLTLYCLLQFLNPESPLLRSLAGFRSWLLYTWLIFAGYEMLQSQRQVRQIYALILSLSTITALYGVYQWRQGPSALMGHNATLDFFAERMTWGGGLEGDTAVFRAFSTFTMPASFATNMALGVLIAFVVIGARGNPRWLRSLAIAGTPLMGAGLAASGSRGPLVILVLGLAVVAALRRGRSAVPILILGAATVWAATSLTTNLISLRYARLLDLSYVNGRWIEPLCRGLTIAAEHPLGMGLGYTAGMPVLSRVLTRGATTSDRFAPDSAFAGIQTTNVDSGIGGAAAELGFPGVLIFLFLLVQLALCPLRSWRQIADPSLKELLLAPVSFALVFAMTAVVWPITASLPMSIYFWVLIGMALKAPHLNTEPGEVGEPPTPEAAPRVAPAGRLVSDAP